MGIRASEKSNFTMSEEYVMQNMAEQRTAEFEVPVKPFDWPTFSARAVCAALAGADHVIGCVVSRDVLAGTIVCGVSGACPDELVALRYREVSEQVFKQGSKCRCTRHREVPLGHAVRAKLHALSNSERMPQFTALIYPTGRPLWRGGQLFESMNKIDCARHAESPLHFLRSPTHDNALLPMKSLLR